MILDKELEFCEAQAITAAAISENVYDRGTANDDMIVGNDLVVILQVTTTFLTIVSLLVELVSDSTADLATSPTTHCSRALLLAQLEADLVYVIGKPSGGPSERYLGVKFTPTTDATAGAVSVWLGMDAQQNPGR